MKIPAVQSINNISALLAEVGTDYFDLLLYHYPFLMFDSKAQLKQSWIYMTLLKQSRFVKRIGVSNFYASHLLDDVCQEFNLEKPFAKEIQINPYVYCLDKDTLDLCFQKNGRRGQLRWMRRICKHQPGACKRRGEETARAGRPADTMRKKKVVSAAAREKNLEQRGDSEVLRAPEDRASGELLSVY